MKPILLIVCTPLAIGMTVAAWDPWTPSFESLVIDIAYVREIRPKNHLETTVTLATENGLLLTCKTGYKASSHCPVHTMEQAMKNNSSIKVWHDAAVVYQAEIAGKLVIDYSHVYAGRRILAAFFGFISSLPLLVALGRRVGLINKPSAA